MLGADVAGYALSPPTTPCLFELTDASKNMISALGDVHDPISIQNLVSDFRPEIIIHMAAQALVRQSYYDPPDTYATNIMGTVHLLEAVRSVDDIRAV